MNYKEKRKRGGFRSQEYQKKIIASSIFPSLLISIVFTAVFVFFPEEVRYTIRYSNPFLLTNLSPVVFFIVCFAWVILFVFLIRTFYLANEWVGTFERIIRELDEVLSGKGRDKIVAREGDDLANALLKRVNELIQNYKSSGK